MKVNNISYIIFKKNPTSARRKESPKKMYPTDNI